MGRSTTKYNLTRTSKECGLCRRFKSLAQFLKRSDSIAGYTTYCRLCRRLKGRISAKIRYRKETRRFADRNRRSRLKAEYGITVSEYDILLMKQDFKCAICKRSTDTIPSRLAIDHCHKTNKIRGLLCAGCNLGLGNFRDNTSLLSNAIHYLRGDNNGLLTGLVEQSTAQISGTVAL